MKRICCIGAGYVGGPTMAVIARHWPEYRVEVVDIDPKRIAAWNSDHLPIYEPGLDELVKSVRGRNLFFYDDVEAHIDPADIIFVSVNTPTKAFGHGAGRAADLQYWERTARQIARVATTPKIVVEKSTLPVRTAEAMESILRQNPRGVHFEVVSNPEFLAEGTAIRDLEQPDRVLIGGHDTPSGRAAVQEIVEIYARWVPREKIIVTGLWSSELAKLTANAFLAQRISSINSISAVCELTEANVTEVARAVGMDHRIGPHFLCAGVGFGGSCFRKDILNLAYLAETLGLHEVARYWQQVVEINDFQRRRFVQTMLKAMYGTLAGRRIAVFGFAFKPDTSDTRDSPAVEICRLLHEERAHLAITDPRALPNARKDLEGLPDCSFEEDPYDAARGAHAIALLTRWPEYRELDYERIYLSMEKPPFIFDGWNLLDHARLARIGFHVYRVGAPPVAPTEDRAAGLKD